MGKNEIAKSNSKTPSSYSQKNFDKVDIANVTDVHRETYEPLKKTVEDIHSETYVSTSSSSKKK